MRFLIRGYTFVEGCKTKVNNYFIFKNKMFVIFCVSVDQKLVTFLTLEEEIWKTKLDIAQTKKTFQ